MKNNDEKRIAGCWKILYMLHIGDKEVVVGENLTEPNEARYMCAYCEATDLFRGYGECMVSDDYLEMMGLNTERIAGQIEAVKAKVACFRHPSRPLRQMSATRTTVRREDRRNPRRGA